MDLLNEMVELMKPGEEKTQLFAILFMCCLPPQVRVQLTEDDYTDLRALAEKADRCTTILARKASTVAGAVLQCEDDSEEPASSVTAIHSGGSFHSGTGSQHGSKKTGFWQQKKQQRQKSSNTNSPPDATRVAASLCYPHFKFGAKAHSCYQPCSCTGN